MHTHTYIKTFIYTYRNIVCIHVHVHTHMYIHAQTYTNVYIHTYTFTVHMNNMVVEKSYGWSMNITLTTSFKAITLLSDQNEYELKGNNAKARISKVIKMRWALIKYDKAKWCRGGTYLQMVVLIIWVFFISSKDSCLHNQKKYYERIRRAQNQKQIQKHYLQRVGPQG